MRHFGSIILLAAATGMAGCGDASDADNDARAGGRYVGIGIYAPGSLWQRMVAASRPANAAAATLRDDDQVIVTVDSRTGEVRQCGNLSGYCIGMNPWSRPLDPEQAAPVNVTEHGVDLERAAARQAEPVSNEVEATMNGAALVQPRR